MKIKKLNLSQFLNKDLLILLLIVVIGSFLRLQGVLTNSFAYTYDVGRDMIALWNIVVNHDLMFIGATTGIQGVFYGPWWYYMLVPFFVIFRGDPTGIALTMSLVGISSIILSFLVGRKIGGNLLGFSLAVLVSVSPALISLSSQIWNPNIAPLFVLLTFYSLYKIYSLDKISNKYFFILGILLSINIDIEILWGLLFALGVVFSLILVLNKKIKIKQIIYLFLGILAVASPRIVFELKHGFLMTKSFILFLTSKNSTEDPLTFIQVLEGRVFSFVDLFSSSLTFNSQLMALVVIVLTLLSLILFYKKSSEVIKRFIVTLLTIVGVFFVGTVIFSRALWPHYLVGLPIVYIFLFAISLFLFSKKLNNFMILVFAVIILSIFNFDPINQIKSITSPVFEGNSAVYRNQLAVVDYVYREARGKDFKYVVYTPPVYDYTYRYLFTWYGPSKYKYSSSQEARTAFFIIEPDPGYEDRPKWWLKARENDGTIIKSATVSGGIVVQTRVH